jgi:hypothetical protein
VDDGNMLSNILSSLRFRNELADLYNKGIGHGELKQNWLSNILVIDSSVIEGILFAAMAKIESNCKRINCKKILKCSFFPERDLHSTYLKNYTFTTLTDALEKMKVLTVKKEKIDSVRSLRNNIHMNRMDFDLASSNKFSATSITEANNLIKDISDNLASNLGKIKTPPCLW